MIIGLSDDFGMFQGTEILETWHLLPWNLINERTTILRTESLWD